MPKFDHERRVRPLDGGHVADALRDLASEATEELHDARRRLSEQLQIAARVHRSLLPPAARHPRIHVDVRYIPLGTLNGDYFQVRFQDDLSLCYITMCHVIGDGIAPALLASRISSEARHFIDEELCPSDMIHELNRFFCEYFHDLLHHTSFIAARIDLRNRLITYSGAGHAAGILLRPQQGLVHRMASQHCSIGVKPEILNRESECTVQMAAGDRLLFFADGITQMMNEEHDPLGQHGLERFAVDAMLCDLFTMLDALLADVRRFRDGPASKDITLVVAEIQ